MNQGTHVSNLRMLFEQNAARHVQSIRHTSQHPDEDDALDEDQNAIFTTRGFTGIAHDEDQDAIFRARGFTGIAHDVEVENDGSGRYRNGKSVRDLKAIWENKSDQVMQPQLPTKSLAQSRLRDVIRESISSLNSDDNNPRISRRRQKMKSIQTHGRRIKIGKRATASAVHDYGLDIESPTNRSLYKLDEESQDCHKSAEVSFEVDEKEIFDTTIIDYVTMMSPDYDAIRRKNSEELADYYGEVHLPMKFQSIFSHRDQVKDTDVPPGLELFIFPNGAFLRLSFLQPTLFQFVLTLQDGSRVNAYTCIVYQIFQDDEELEWRFQEHFKFNSQVKIYVPSAITILSRRSLHNTFLGYLASFISAQSGFSISKIQEMDLTIIAQELFLSLTPCISMDENAIEVVLYVDDKNIPLGTEFHFIKSQINSTEPPIVDVNMKYLFRMVSPNNVIMLLNALLCEYPVIICSLDIRNLAPVCETILTLLYPFQWPFLYIPSLPLSLIDVLQAPQPYIIGVSSILLDLSGPLDHAFIINLDNNILMKPSDLSSFVELPWRLSWRLYRSISKFMNFYKMYNPKSLLERPENLPNHAVHDDWDQDFELKELAIEESVPKPYDDLDLGTASVSKYKTRRGRRWGYDSVISYKTIGDLYSGSDIDSEEGKNAIIELNLRHQQVEYWVDLQNWMFKEGIILPLPIPNGNILAEDEEIRRSKSLDVNRTTEFRPKFGFSKRQKKRKQLDHVIPETRPRRTSLNHMYTKSDEKLDERLQSIDVMKLRKGFLSVFVSLICKYRDFIKDSDTDFDQFPDELFDYESFLVECESTKTAFMKKLVETQMFAYFIQERSCLDDPDWFDFVCLLKKRRDMKRLKKYASEEALGYLWKRSKRFSGWSWYLFIVDDEMEDDGSLVTYIRCYKPAKKLLRSIRDYRSLSRENEDAAVEELEQSLRRLKRKYCKGVLRIDSNETKITIPDSEKYRTPYVFEVRTGNEYFTLCADHSSKRREWIRCLKSKMIKEEKSNFRKFKPRLTRTVMDPYALQLQQELSSAIQAHSYEQD